MSSDEQEDGQTSKSAGPRPADGPTETPAPSSQKEENTVKSTDKTQQNILQALNTFLADKDLEKPVISSSPFVPMVLR